MTDIKDRYREFCAQQPDLPVFIEPWFLEAVCGGEEHWEVVLSYKGEELVGAWPFFKKKKIGMEWVAVPPLWRYGGPYLVPERRDLAQSHRIYADLLEQMPKFAAFEQDLHPSILNGMPMHWAGFELLQRYTYVLDNVTNAEEVWAKMTSDYRKNKISKAEELVEIVAIEDAKACFEVMKKTFDRQEGNMPYSQELFMQLDDALSKHGRRIMLAAIDKKTKALHAVGYTIFDNLGAYFLMAGSDPNLRSSGAGILVIYESILYAIVKLGLPRFDFLGSMIEPIERVNRQFGAAQKSFLRIRKTDSKLFRLKKYTFG